MGRRRTFTKGEIMDAARAAAETGLNARLLPDGVIEFLHNTPEREKTPEDYLEEYIQSRAGSRL